MKLQLLIMLALFPFLHSEPYPVTLSSCEPEKIVLKHEGKSVRVSLFNLKITDERGWTKACDLLKSTKKIRFEVDLSSSIKEPIPVYLFADDKLIQAEVIKSGYGYPMIRNPEYKYEKQMEDAFDSKQTMAKPVEEEKTSSYAFVAPIFLFSVIVIWLIMLYFILCWRKSRLQQRSKKSPLPTSKEEPKQHDK